MDEDARKLLIRALNALNYTPRFKLPEGDSYKLAADITDYLWKDHK